MLKSKGSRLGVALSVAMVFVLPGTALAQKKITYEEAFRRCKAFMDKEKGGLGGGATGQQAKFARGAACMQKFGYRI